MEYKLTAEDHIRRRNLNQERNSRVTVMGEATNRINPINGRYYNDNKVEPESCFYDGILFEIRKPIHDIPEFFSYQLTLAKMDARDEELGGHINGHIFAGEYQQVTDLIWRLASAGIPLDSINTTSGLDAALKGNRRRATIFGNPIDRDIDIRTGDVFDYNPYKEIEHPDRYLN